MSTEALFENVSRHMKAIDLCIENKLRTPALILVYAGIDIFAALNRPEDKEEGSRKDFKHWCEKYMLSKKQLRCSAGDLYAARCGVVHSYSSQSRLTRQREAREIVYSWGSQSPEPLQSVLDSIEYPANVLHIETLVESFKAGVNEFLGEIAEDDARIQLVVIRAAKFFKDKPREFWR